MELSMSKIHDWYLMVPGKGIEPPHGYPYQILSLARLPVPPPRHLAKDGKYKESRWPGKPVYPDFC